MLHDALAGDAEFLRQFRAEARAAAALSHPNVMAVFDWGDDEVAFIVTEYLSGGSLRGLLDSGALLTPSQALLVGLEAARGLDYAHRRGFVHRDIKPANLLFGEEQRLRIADFGLARALAEAAWTEPQGAVLGTARYAAPEQAKGETLSGKADVYALALVLVEAVTGTVPFTSDTTLGTLMARVDKHLVVPDELGPLQAVLTRAGHPDPDQRIDARALAAGLLRAAKALPTPAALPLVGAVAPDGLVVADLDPTIHGPGPLAAGPSDLTADDLELDPPDWVNRTEPGPTPADDEPTRFEPSPAPTADDGEIVAAGVAAVVAPVPVPGSGPPDVPGDDDADRDDANANGNVDGPRRRRWPWMLVVLALLIGGGAAAAVAANDNATATGPRIDLPVPRLVGRTEAQARAVASAAGWTVHTVAVRRDHTTKGEVLATRPAAGTRLESGRALVLTVSAGQTIVAVPTDLAGKTLQQATVTLFETGFATATGATRYDENAAKGVVLGAMPGTPARLEKGSTVRLLVSSGPHPRTVPSGLVGGTAAAARAALAAVQLTMAEVDSFSDSVPKGQVISVLPAAGTSVPRGSAVNVEVSKGPKLVAVPSVAGSGSISAAVARLTAAGLQAGSVSGPASGSPQGTSPAAGTMVRPGSTVNIILG